MLGVGMFCGQMILSEELGLGWLEWEEHAVGLLRGTTV